MHFKALFLATPTCCTSYESLLGIPLLIFQGHIAGEDISILHPLLHVWMSSSMVQHQTTYQSKTEEREDVGGKEKERKGKIWGGGGKERRRWWKGREKGGEGQWRGRREKERGGEGGERREKGRRRRRGERKGQKSGRDNSICMLTQKACDLSPTNFDL